MPITATISALSALAILLRLKVSALIKSRVKPGLAEAESLTMK
jgi:hypothetical protein